LETVIVLAMHGSPPLDFPKNELAEFFALHARFEHAPPSGGSPARGRFLELEEKIRRWPRSPANDPFHAGSERLAEELRKAGGREVFLGFNEFCAPTLDEALAAAAETNPVKVIVITPMMTPGGEHSERDIPAAIGRARKSRPGTEFVYAWPFPPADVAAFLASELTKLL
jgi:sirohydrochlorin cobaltochelatase